ncbi:GntR family transcriptional regulator [Streptomyces sp. NPDC017988]|uniref:GntR family transcriptional regulator n=1 Tax=Streptomyces sp. NPDC017988 TaxID=3365025 RepID=UPI0037B332CE
MATGVVRRFTVGSRWGEGCLQRADVIHGVVGSARFDSGASRLNWLDCHRVVTQNLRWPVAPAALWLPGPWWRTIRLWSSSRLRPRSAARAGAECVCRGPENEADATRPKWEQIAEEIRRRIASEEYPVHGLISEVRLEQEFGVSRVTVRKATAALRAEGLIVTTRGMGSFVADK